MRALLWLIILALVFQSAVEEPTMHECDICGEQCDCADAQNCVHNCDMEEVDEDGDYRTTFDDEET